MHEERIIVLDVGIKVGGRFEGFGRAIVLQRSPPLCKVPPGSLGVTLVRHAGGRLAAGRLPGVPCVAACPPRMTCL